MGFFSKLKQNINHGGVKVTMQAGQSVSQQNPNLPATITITNGPEAAQTVNKVTLKVDATERNYNHMTSGVSIGVGSSNNMMNNNMQNQIQVFTIAQTENNEQFVLQPGESKVVNMAITVGGAAVPNQAGGVLGNIEKVMGAVGSYTYELIATADVDGIALDPHAKQSLQILQ